MQELERIVSAFFELANDRDILKNVGKISHEIVCDKPLTKFEKYGVKQDILFESNFDKFILEIKNENKGESNL